LLMCDEKPNLILLDIMMDRPLDGVEVCKQIQDKTELGKIPIVIISSISHSHHASMFPTDEYIPIDDWINKPVEPKELLGKVEYYLERYHN